MQPVVGTTTQRRWLLFAYATTAGGSAVATGLYPMVSILVLNQSAAYVAALSLVSGFGGAIAAIVTSRWLGRNPTRSLRALEVIQAATLAAVLVSLLSTEVGSIVLMVAAAVQASCFLLYGTALGMVIRLLYQDDELLPLNAGIESATWTTTSVGPPIGGAMFSFAGPVPTILLNIVTFVAGFFFLRKVPATRAEPIKDGSQQAKTRTFWPGIRLIFRTPVLRGLYLNAMLLGGALIASTPMIALFVLRELQLPPWQYGLVLGIPMIFGLLGSRMARGADKRFGQRRSLLLFGSLRAVALAPIAFLPIGSVGLVMLLCLQILLMWSAGVFNPIYATLRQQLLSPEEYRQVVTVWSASAKIIQPLCVAAGAVTAEIFGTRGGLILVAALAIVSCLGLPVRRRDPQSTMR